MAEHEERIILSVSAELKVQLQSAADALGQSLSTFITDAALKKALQVAERQAGGLATSVPSYFRALCVQAHHGGPSGYVMPGWYLGAILATQRPREVDAESWERHIDALKALMANQDDEAIWQWLRAHCEACMALVPSRRREQFLHGLRRAYEEDLINP